MRNRPVNAQQEQHPHLYLFTLRVWQEGLGEGKTEWRGRVQDVTNGETLFFRDWPGLIPTLERLIARTAAPQASDPGTALPEPKNEGLDHDSVACDPTRDMV